MSEGYSGQMWVEHADTIDDKTDGITIHQVSWKEKEIIIAQYNGRFDIHKILLTADREWAHFIRDKTDVWTELSENLVKAPAILSHKCSRTDIPGRKLHMVPEQLLYSALSYCKDDEYTSRVLGTISENMGRAIEQYPEMRCNVVVDDSTGLVMAISEYNDEYCNVNPIIDIARSSKTIKKNKYALSEFIDKKDTHSTIDYIIAVEYPELANATRQEKIDKLYYKQYGTQWMHSKLAQKFAMNMCPEYEYAVLKLIDRISRGDFTVIPDIIQTVDQVSGTKTLAQFWTYDEKLLEENPYALESYQRQVQQLTLDVKRLTLEKKQTQLQLTDTQTSFQTFQMVVAVPEKTTQRALRIAKGPRAQSFHTSFDFVRECEGMLHKQVEELTYEVARLKESIMLLEQRNIILQENDNMTNKLIDDLDDEINEHMGIYIKAKELAGRVITYAMEHGLTIPLRKCDKKAIDRETLQRIESKSIYIKKKLANIRMTSDNTIVFNDGIDKMTKKKPKPEIPFTFEPRYTGTPINTETRARQKMGNVTGPVYIYCIRHDHRSTYFKWVMHDMGDMYKEETGYSTILSDAPFENIDRDHMIFVGTINRKPYERVVINNDKTTTTITEITDETDPAYHYYKLSTAELLKRFARLGCCKENHFQRADGDGYVVFTTPTHPKVIEKELCYMMRYMISHKTYGSNTTKSFDNWITELTSLYARTF